MLSILGQNPHRQNSPGQNPPTKIPLDNPRPPPPHTDKTPLDKISRTKPSWTPSKTPQTKPPKQNPPDKTPQTKPPNKTPGQNPKDKTPLDKIPRPNNSTSILN